jgi:oligopeptide/dipeptide ABC transporter ATP-binding protein
VSAGPLLEVADLTVHFAVRRGLLGRERGVIRAVDGVSLSVDAGETLALLGESGSGKTSVARGLLRLARVRSGRVLVRVHGGEPVDLLALRGAALRAARRELALVFQDPYESLNPRHPVREIVGEPLRVHRGLSGTPLAARTAELLERVGVPADAATRFPHEFSGGQRQRIAIARALALEPSFVALDEPVSLLDVSVQAQVLGLLRELQRERSLAYLFVSHDVSVVGAMAERVAVMSHGRMVESGATEDVLGAPAHPVTRALVEAAPALAPGARAPRVLPAAPRPSPLALPSGCPHRTRCPLAVAVCAERVPPVVEVAPGHWAECHRAGE